MNESYEDIRERIPLPPVWWDENAVPRYCKFSPKKIANIYATECVLLRISCQNCRREFNVARSFHRLTLSSEAGGKESIEAYLQDGGEISYGDPPNIDCCAPGPSMSSDTICVLEFWTRDNKKHDWTRKKKLEKKF
jgi:hypothetical protein